MKRKLQLTIASLVFASLVGCASTKTIDQLVDEHIVEAKKANPHLVIERIGTNAVILRDSREARQAVPTIGEAS